MKNSRVILSITLIITFTSLEAFGPECHRLEWLMQRLGAAIANKQPLDSVVKEYYIAANDVLGKRNEGKRTIDLPTAIKRSHRALRDKRGEVLTCGETVIEIGEKDVGCNGLILKKPALYRLKENICFKPKKDGVVAITISGDCIKLDLNGKKLSTPLAVFDEFDDISGIVVTPGSDFITITNGKVANFSNFGVAFLSDTLSVTDHRGIVVDKVTVTDCGKLTTDPNTILGIRYGIGVEGATDVTITHSVVSGIKSRSEVDGIALNFVDDGLIDGCTSRSNSVPRLPIMVDPPIEPFAIGISLLFFNDCVVKNSSGVHNEGWSAIGLAAAIGSNLAIHHVQGSFNDATRFSNGLQVAVSTSVTIDKAITSDNVAENRNESLPPEFQLAAAEGILIVAGNAGVTVRDCIAHNQQFVSTVGTGIRPQACFGFGAAFSADIIFECCSASNNTTGADTLEGEVSGFRVEDCDNVVMRGCIATNNSINNAAMICAGFLIGAQITPDKSDSSNVILDSCIAEANNNAANLMGAGIRLGEIVTNSCIINSIAKNNDIGILLIGEFSDDITNNLIQDNRVLGNNTFGISDQTANQTNAYTGSFAYTPGGINYLTGGINNTLPAGNLLRLWPKTMGLGPIGSDASFANADVR